jgi:ABC-type multidrug transport system fused ATPase/permease subunit
VGTFSRISIGGLAAGRRRLSAEGMPAREIRFRGVTFAYPGGAPVLEGLDLTIPAGSSLAIVGKNGAVYRVQAAAYR